jgi:hypothetical protein
LFSAIAGTLQPTWVPAQNEAAPVVVLIGGLNGRDQSTESVEHAPQSYERTPAQKRRFNLFGLG